MFLKDTKPEFKKKLDVVTTEIVDEIKKSCREDIASVNKVIKDSLSIPENVLLVYDSLLATESTQADVDLLSEECQRLEKNVLEVKIDKLMINWWIIYFLLQNAFFIHALYAEIETYEKLQEIFENEVFVASKAEEQLNNNLDASLLLHTAKKIHTLMSWNLKINKSFQIKNWFFLTLNGLFDYKTSPYFSTQHRVSLEHRFSLKLIVFPKSLALNWLIPSNMNPEKLKKLQAQAALVRIGGKGEYPNQRRFSSKKHYCCNFLLSD